MSDPHRFRPTRAGIANLYEYVDQTFGFSGGRLLLRGHNTSGKTKALELLLPFVLDGNTSPHRLDPFAQSAKEMHWNVVGCTDAEQRLGYVWIEFERIDDGGGVERVTAGIGLRAHRARPEVRRWHFVVGGRRVGHDLLLVRDGREPLSRNDLAAAIGDDGDVFDRQSDYRARLRETVLSHVANEEQHQTMLRLMRELRRPHLSKTLDPEGVAEMLSAGLPEVDEALMRRLAGGLEQLESLEVRLRRLRAVRDRVRLFHERTYRAYLRAELRERGAALRSADSRFDRESEALRQASAEHERTVADAQRLAAQLRAAIADVERWEGEERALVTSSAWAAVAEVEALRERAEAQERAAETLRERHEDETAAAAEHEAELVLAREAEEQARGSASAELERLAGEARRAGLGERTRALDEQLVAAALTPRTWRELVAELAAGRASLLGEHAKLLAAARAALEELERTRERERAAGEIAAAATAARDGAHAELEQRRAQAGAAIDGWAAGLRELAPDASALQAARTLADVGRSPVPAFDAAVARVRDVLAGERAGLGVERERLADDRAVLDERRAQLEAERDEPPPAPAWRDADRGGRPGAPLWALVDFASALPQDERGAVEAALDAAGLLDAWITPTGEALPSGTHDAALAPAAAVDGRSLADVLEPVRDGAVPGAVVDRVLRAIALGDRRSAAGSGTVAVAPDGHFQLGLLQGAATREGPEYIGAAARAARRARLLTEVAQQRAALDSRIRALDAQLAELAERGRRLDDELAALPSVDEVAGALRAVGVADAHAQSAAAAHEAARTALALAEDAELAARSDVREHAAAHALEPGLDEAGAAARRDACVRLEAGCGGVAQRFEHVAAVRADADRLTTRLARLRERAALLGARAREEQAEARRLVAEHAARDGALGADAQDVRTRHEHAQRALRAARRAREDAAEAERATAIAVAGLERDAGAARERVDDARRGRERAHQSLVALAGCGLLELALGADAPADHAAAHGWPLTRALEAARALPDSVTSSSTPPGRLAENVMRAVSELDRELAQADMGAHAVPADDGLLLVQVIDGTAPRPFGEALAALDAEIDERERVLSESERRVFGDAIVEELAEHLRRRIHDVRARVGQMNAVLRRAPTAGGKIVQLEWRGVDDDELREAVATLRRSVAHFDDARRGAIVGFFRDRIAQARRAAAERAGAPEPMAQTLAAAFDYRAWHRFDLMLELDGRSERLTKRSHAVGSGGEQSALIHLPLFAAAAAMYGDGHGPRLVMLDEALSGIDDETRERVLAATVAFDLDLVMTSHELWGTYTTVPSLAIHQLHRQNGVYGVHAVSFLWDGAELREDEQGELFVT